MRQFLRALGMTLILAVASHEAWAQRVAIDAIRVGEPGAVYVLELRDGSTLVGTILAVTAESVRIELKSGTLDVARADIAAVRKASGRTGPGGAVWPENPAGNRLLIGPTALPLEKGETTFSTNSRWAGWWDTSAVSATTLRSTVMLHSGSCMAWRRTAAAKTI